MGRGRFVGVGVDRYAHHADLEQAVADVRAVREALGADFEGEPVENPTEEEARAYLRAVKRTVQDGPLILLWSGHGLPATADDLRLVATDTGTDPDEGIGIRDAVTSAALSGASQILVVFDTCYSGAALSVADRAMKIFRDAVPNVGHLWVGALSSCLDVETARDGAFGKLLARVIADGPADPDTQVRAWSPHNAFVSGDDLGNAVLAEWDGLQHPEFLRRGLSWHLVRNPRYDQGAPEQVVEHLLRAARSGAPLDQPSRFTGRVVEVNQVVDWVRSGEPGLHVVTGSAGTGKSAIVGRVVSMSNPEERFRLLRDGRPEHADPGPRSVDANVHARGLTADRAAELIADQLVRVGTLTAQDDRRNAAELVGQVQRAVADGGRRPPVIVVDGLDEARGEAFTLAEELLDRLARHATVIVSTRDVPGDAASLVDVLGGPGLDLDTPDGQSRGRADMGAYLVARLTGVSPIMDADAIAEHLLTATSMTGSRPFLLARLVADQLAAAPVDTSVAGWEQQISTSIEAAFDADIAQIEPPGHRPMTERPDSTDLAKTLLTALTWGLGAGFPEEEWLACAGAISDVPANPDDVGWVLDQLGRYIVQDGSGGVAVYRLAHQSLADHLRPPHPGGADAPFDPAALPIAVAMLDRYRGLLDKGISAEDPTYLWRFAWGHAAAAGPAGLDLLRRLTLDTPVLRLDVALAAADVSDRFGYWGHRIDAVPPAEEAFELHRGLAAQNPGYLPNLASALNNLGIRYADVGWRAEAVGPTEEAITLYRELSAQNPGYLPDLAGALNNLGIRYADVGRRAEAVGPTEEAVTLYRELSAQNPGYLPDLAMALTNLGIRYAEVGRRAEAVGPTEEAVTLRRAQATQNPGYLPDLAGALNNLGTRYAEVGRDAEAVGPTEEAVTLRRAQATQNPGYLPDLAGALNNLGVRYAEVGRRTEAVGPTEEAVTLYRRLAAQNPGYLPNLASALNNLGIRYAEVGRRTEAVGPTEEAVTLRRAQATQNPGYLPNLATALNNLGNRYAEMGLRAEAVGPTEEAVTLRRAQATQNPGYLPSLAGTLSNLGNRYAEVGRDAEAIGPTEEAVELWRAQAAHNLGRLPDLAGTLNNLGNRYAEVGRDAEAIGPTEEAVTLFRRLAAQNPGYLPNLASALNNLGIRYAEVGRRAEAVGPTEEAVGLRRVQAAQNPGYLPNLASTLNNLGNRYAEAGRRVEAVGPTEKAVELYQELAPQTPHYLPDLASALNNLGIRYAGVGSPERATAAWTDTSDRLDQALRAVLLLYRARYAEAGDSRAVEWLVTVERGAGEDRELTTATHAEARRHRSVDPASFDTAWEAATGSVPGWLRIETALLDVAWQWAATETYEDEHSHLADHPELLDAAADTAVEEALLDVPADEAVRYLQLRAAARAEGVDAAYRPTLLHSLAARFIAAGPDGWGGMLSGQRPNLLSDELREIIDDWAQDRPGATADPAAQVAAAVLDLAAAGEDISALEAIEDPALFPALLQRIATQPDTGALAPAALLAHRAGHRTDALFFLAVAQVIAGGGQPARLLRSVRTADPGREPEWLNLLADIGRIHPQVLTLIPVLTAPMEDTMAAAPAEASGSGEGASGEQR